MLIRDSNNLPKYSKIASTKNGLLLELTRAINSGSAFKFDDLVENRGQVNTSLFLTLLPATSRCFVFTAKHCYADGTRRHCCFG